MAQLLEQLEDGNKEPCPNAEFHLRLLPGPAYKRSRHNGPAAVGLDISIVLLPGPHGKSERKEITSAVGRDAGSILVIFSLSSLLTRIYFSFVECLMVWIPS